jgi:hypothetical protein
MLRHGPCGKGPAGNLHGGCIPSLPRPAGEQRFDLAGVATAIMGDGSDQTALMRNILAGRGGLELSAGKGRSARIRIDLPPADTVELSVDAVIGDDASEMMSEGFVIALGPTTLNPVNQTTAMPFSVAFTARHSGAVTMQGLPRVWTSLPFDERDPKRIRLHLVVEYGQVTGELNGRPLCHVPCAPSANPGRCISPQPSFRYRSKPYARRRWGRSRPRAGPRLRRRQRGRPSRRRSRRP